MGLFGRKSDKGKESREQRETPESAQFRSFAEDFLPEELDVLAVTGPGGFGAEPWGEGDLSKVSLELTAWRDEYEEEVHRGSFGLVTLADERMQEYLRVHVPRNFLVRFRARASRDGERLLLLDLPKPAFDPELNAILDEQKTPVTVEAGDLGTFTLNRAVGWFTGDVDWLGQPVQLTFDQEEDQESCLQTARALLAAQEDWDRRAKAFAARQLLPLVNAWDDGGAENEAPGSMTEEQFAAHMEAESIQVNAAGELEFWFIDPDLSWEHSIHVTAALDTGPTDAQLDG